jgi:hypothetical protein
MEFKVSRRWRLLEGSRRGDDEWLSRPLRALAEAHQQGQDRVQRCVAPCRGPYGTRRITYLWRSRDCRAVGVVLGDEWPKRACAAPHGAGSKRPRLWGTLRAWPRASAIGS